MFHTFKRLLTLSSGNYSIPTVMVKQGQTVPSFLESFIPQMKQSPGFYAHRGLIIDFGHVQPHWTISDYTSCLETLRSELTPHHILVTGVTGVDTSTWQRMQVSDRYTRMSSQSSRAFPSSQNLPAKNENSHVHLGALRGGQTIHLKTTQDVVVMGNVRPGAEIVTNGSVHVYGKLLGRVHAGAQGNKLARIWTLTCSPELLAIAGVFATGDGIPAHTDATGIMAHLDQRNGKETLTLDTWS